MLFRSGVLKLNLKPGGVSSLLQINDLKNSPGPSKIRVSTKQTLAMLHDNYSKMVAKNVGFLPFMLLFELIVCLN